MQSASADHGVIAFLHAGQTGVVAGNTLAACPGGVLYNGDTSGFAFANNTILNGSAINSAVVVTPSVVVVPSAPGVLTVTATTQTPGAVLRYTIDGSRVTSASRQWPSGGVTVGARATAVLVKGACCAQRPICRLLIHGSDALCRLSGWHG